MFTQITDVALRHKYMSDTIRRELDGENVTLKAIKASQVALIWTHSEGISGNNMKRTIDAEEGGG